MMMKVKRVEHVSDYKLKIFFSDGKIKIVDFEDWINEGGYYGTSLKNINYFKKVKMDESSYSICWPNGADFSPDALYENGVEVQELKKPIKAKPKISKQRKKSDKAQIKYQTTSPMTKKRLKNSKI